jgi:hypothetical protein
MVLSKTLQQVALSALTLMSIVLTACNVANGGDGAAAGSSDAAIPNAADAGGDAGTSADAATAADTGTAPDAGTVEPADNDVATLPPDALVTADAAVAADAGPVADAIVTPPDAVVGAPDSGPASGTCGNLTCEAGESASNCPSDCGAMNQCVLSHCQVQATACMNSSNCRQAFACLQACAVADATCQQQCLAGKSSKTLNNLSALTDCTTANCTSTQPPAPVCGNGVCESGETTANCAQDCPAPAAFCGDGVCNGGETYTTCAQDCPAPAKTCTTYLDVQPIFLANCNGCHGHSFGSSCSAAANYPLIATYVANGSMPQNGSLSSGDKAKIAAWAAAKNACTTASCP